MRKNYIAYLRVSNKEHDTSIPAQRKLVQEYAERKNLNLVEVFEEKKGAYKHNSRKIFPKMLDYLSRDDVDGVIFHKVDRSARNMPDFVKLERFFGMKDIRVMEGEFDTSKAQGRMAFRMFCNMAVFYSENLSEEVTTKTRILLEKGYYPNKPFFGYRNGTKDDPDRKKKYPNHEARTIKMMFEMYSSGAYSYADLAEKLNTDGIRREKGRKWDRRNIERIIKKKFYYGIIEWKVRKTGEVLTFKGNHKPIIDKALFDRCKNLRIDRTKNSGSMSRVHAYSKRMYCDCGSLMYTEIPTDKHGERTRTYIRCHNKQCPTSSIRQYKIHETVVEALASITLPKELFEAYTALIEHIEKDRVEAFKKDQEGLRMELARIDERKNKINEGYEAGLYDIEEAKKRKSDLTEEHQSIEVRLEGGAPQPQFFKTVTEFLETFKFLSSKYETAPTKLQIEILQLCFSKLTLTPEKLLIERTPILEGVLKLRFDTYGWGGGIRTPDRRHQKPPPYRLATPQILFVNKSGRIVKRNREMTSFFLE